MGFELDRSVLDDLHAVAGLHGTLLLTQPGAAPVFLHSSLPADHQPAQLAALRKYRQKR